MLSCVVCLHRDNALVTLTCRFIELGQHSLLVVVFQAGSFDAGNFENVTIGNQSIDACFPWTPEELTIWVSLTVQGGVLTIGVLLGRSALESVAKKLDVHLSSSVSEEPRLLGSVKATPFDVDIKVNCSELLRIRSSLKVVDDKVSRAKGQPERTLPSQLGKVYCWFKIGSRRV